jgi:hypothetical protein
MNRRSGGKTDSAIAYGDFAGERGTDVTAKKIFGHIGANGVASNPKI